MYVPNHFRIDERELLDAVIRDNPFGLLVGTVDGAPFATHLPFLLDGERLLAHVARANPHGRAIDGTAEMLAVFSGPHAYVSPRWYAADPSVPTWNYVAVHVYGAPQVVEDPTLARDMLARLVDTHEAGAWTVDGQDAGYIDRMLRGIVAFEMPVTRIEGKFKLNQNRSAADRRGVAEALGMSSDETAVRLARFMQAHAERD